MQKPPIAVRRLPASRHRGGSVLNLLGPQGEDGVAACPLDIPIAPRKQEKTILRTRHLPACGIHAPPASKAGRQIDVGAPLLGELQMGGAKTQQIHSVDGQKAHKVVVITAGHKAAGMFDGSNWAQRCADTFWIHKPLALQACEDRRIALYMRWRGENI